jgi:hypothetical protein
MSLVQFIFAVCVMALGCWLALAIVASAVMAAIDWSKVGVGLKRILWVAAVAACIPFLAVPVSTAKAEEIIASTPTISTCDTSESAALGNRCVTPSEAAAGIGIAVMFGYVIRKMRQAASAGGVKL